MPPAAPSDADVVTGQLALTEDDLARGQIESIRLFRWRWFYAAAMAVLALVSVVGLRQQDAALARAFPYLGFMLAFLGFLFLAPRLLARRSFKALTAPGDNRVTYRFETNAFTLESPAASATFAYRALVGARETRTSFLLYTNPYVATIVPKRAFAASDLPRVQARLSL